MDRMTTVVGGVDTHLDEHVAAALDERGGLLGTRSFPANPAGYRQLLGWLRSFGQLHTVGVEGTGSAISSRVVAPVVPASVAAR